MNWEVDYRSVEKSIKSAIFSQIIPHYANCRPSKRQSDPSPTGATIWPQPFAFCRSGAI